MPENILTSPSIGQNRPERVVFIHGIARSRLCMHALVRTFKKAGYAVHNAHYNYWRQGIRDVGAEVAKQLQPFQEETLHFVCHSMGGLVTRAIFEQAPPKYPGRIVMLGTPNQGAQISDDLQNSRFFKHLYKAVYGKSGKELAASTGVAQSLPSLEKQQVGVISGDGGFNFLTKHLLPLPSDGVVGVEATKLPRMQDYQNRKIGHLWMLYDDGVRQATLNFIKNGRFH